MTIKLQNEYVSPLVNAATFFLSRWDYEPWIILPACLLLCDREKRTLLFRMSEISLYNFIISFSRRKYTRPSEISLYNFIISFSHRKHTRLKRNHSMNWLFERIQGVFFLRNFTRLPTKYTSQNWLETKSAFWNGIINLRKRVFKPKTRFFFL